MSFFTNTDPHPKHTRGVLELRRFFAVGTVSNSPHSYSIQSSLFSSNFKGGMVLQKKMKKMTWAKSASDPKTRSHEFVHQTRPNANRTCGHIRWSQPCDAERFGPVVVENEPKSASVGVLMMRRGY